MTYRVSFSRIFRQTLFSQSWVYFGQFLKSLQTQLQNTDGEGFQLPITSKIPL